LKFAIGFYNSLYHRTSRDDPGNVMLHGITAHPPGASHLAACLPAAGSRAEQAVNLNLISYKEESHCSCVVTVHVRYLAAVDERLLSAGRLHGRHKQMKPTCTGDY